MGLVWIDAEEEASVIARMGGGGGGLAIARLLLYMIILQVNQCGPRPLASLPNGVKEKKEGETALF